MRRSRRIAAQVALAVLAVVLFHLGLGVALQLDVTAGMSLWAMAGAILMLDINWMTRSRGR